MSHESMKEGVEETHSRVYATTTKTTTYTSNSGRGAESALYEAVCPAIYVIRVFGLAPYDYPKDNRPPRLRTSNFNCLYTILWMSIYTYIVVMSMIRFSGLDRNRPVLGITENGKLILNYCVSVVDLTLGLIWRKQFVHVWNSIQDFDESFELSNTQDRVLGNRQQRLGPVLRQARFWVWTTLSSGAIGWTIINQLGMHAFNESYLQNVGYMLTYVGTCVAVLKFSGLIFLLGQRFAYLNRQVRRQQMLMLWKKGGRIKCDDAGLVIKKIETSYSELLNTSEKLNDIYSWSLFLYLFNLFCHAVSNMYFFITWTIVDPTYLKNPKVVFCEFTWLTAYLIQLLLLHVACHFTSLEANRMALVLLDWRRHVDRQSKQNDFSSTLHYFNRRLHFSAAGCFNVNLPLLTSISGHLTTYLVILLQLPDNSNS